MRKGNIYGNECKVPEKSRLKGRLTMTECSEEQWGEKKA